MIRTGAKSFGHLNRSTITLTVKVAVSTGLIFVLVANADLSAVSGDLSNLDSFWIAGAFAILVSQILLATIRWTWILESIGVGLSSGKILRIVMVGLFFNQTLPSTIGGDVMRVWELIQTRVDVSRATTSVVIDRFIALSAILLLVTFSLPVLMEVIGSGLAQISLIAASVAGLLGLVAVISLDLLPGMSRDWRVIRWLAGFARDARRVVLSPRVGFAVIGISVLIVVSTGLSVLMIARALQVDIDLLECVVLVPPVMLLSAIPISLAGWGVREAAMVGAFSYAGVDVTQSLLVSIVFGLLVVAIGVPGGVVWLFQARDRDIRAKGTDESVTENP